MPNHWSQRSWSWPVLWRPKTPSRTNTKKQCPFHDRGLKCKSRKARDNQNNRQVWFWSTKWSRAKANRVLSREHAGHSKTLFPTTQETTLYMDIARWSILKSDWLFSLQPKMETLYSESAISSVQSLSCVQLFATPWTAAPHASLFITNSRSLLKLMSIESVMP